MSEECAKCGKRILPNATSCLMCGAKVITAESSEVEPEVFEEPQNKEELMAFLEAREKEYNNRWKPILFCIVASVILSILMMFITKSGAFILFAAFFPFFWFLRKTK